MPTKARTGASQRRARRADDVELHLKASRTTETSERVRESQQRRPAIKWRK